MRREMLFSAKICVLSVVLISLFIIPSFPVSAQTRLGLHVTQEELDIWRDRAVNGPYKSSGDVSTNSPGDWDRIVTRKNAFNSNPSADRYAGNAGSSCITFSSWSQVPENSDAEDMMSAAFYSLVMNDETTRNNVLNELLAQAAEPGTDFSNTNRWCVKSGGSCLGDAYNWRIGNWLTKLAFSYDYIRNYISEADRHTLDAWFEDAGIFWADVADCLVETRFPNRDIDDYDTLGYGYDKDNPQCTWGNCITHYGGYNKWDFHEAWSNRAATQIRAATVIGVLVNNQELKDQGKKWFQEWLQYTVFEDGTSNEFNRWTSSSPCEGWKYTTLLVGSMITVADVLARDGDTSLYELSYTTGLGSITPDGGPKTLLDSANIIASLVVPDIARYGTDSAANNGNANYRIDTEDQLANKYRVNDVYLALGNIYWQDSSIESIYTRTKAGAPAYPSNPAGFGQYVWGGEWGVYPGVLFMFGQMEGKVWPYPDGQPQPTCQNQGYQCCDSCLSGPHPEIDADCSSQVCCDECEMPVQSGSLVSSSTMSANSGNFASDHPVEHLWDGCLEVIPACTSGAGDISSFWVEFDLGEVHDLNSIRLFGDTAGMWVSKTWQLQHKESQDDPWITAFSGEDAFFSDWIEKDLDIQARFVRVEVNSNTGATQARELELYGTPVGGHPADTSGEGCVDMGELTAYINQWLTGQEDVSIPDVMGAVTLWRAGEGCQG